MRGWVVGLVAAVAIVVVAAVGVIAVITSDAQVAIVDLDVGDCFDLPDEADDEADDDGELRSVPLVDCAEPHLAEVVAAGWPVHRPYRT